MNKTKKSLTLTITLMSVFSLVACSETDTTDAREDAKSTMQLADKFADGQKTLEFERKSFI